LPSTSAVVNSSRFGSISASAFFHSSLAALSCAQVALVLVGLLGELAGHLAGLRAELRVFAQERQDLGAALAEQDLRDRAFLPAVLETLQRLCHLIELLLGLQALELLVVEAERLDGLCGALAVFGLSEQALDSLMLAVAMFSIGVSDSLPIFIRPDRLRR
jgi:hypothetical protein